MTSKQNLFVDTAKLPVRMRCRSDLQSRQQSFLGEMFWVLKDPLSMKYTRLSQESFVILQCLDGETSLVTIQERLRGKFPEKEISATQIQQILGSLHRSGLVYSDASQQGDQLFERHQHQLHQRIFQKVTSLLWMRFRGVDPERFLNATYPIVKPLMHPVTLFAAFSVVLFASILVLVNFAEFQQQLPAFHQFFSIENAILLSVTLVVTKVLHEFGHAYACKHFGGECHQIGVLLLIFIPCLYCNTTDAWRLNNKWHRAMIGAAGMYVEIVLASVCTFIWWYSKPGVLHYVSLNVMFTSSISTLVFNANPLLRYDGYYILSDIIEIPNLASRSKNALLAMLRSVALGMRWDASQVMPRRHQAFFATYAVASTVYRWVVLVSILFLLTMIFEPYGLKALGQLMIVVTLFGSVVVPVWKAVKFMLVPGRIKQMKMQRVGITGAVLAAVLLAAFLVPLPSNVSATAEVSLNDGTAVYIPSGGKLDYAIRVDQPTPVQPGATLARLSNRLLEIEICAVKNQLAASESQLKAMTRTQRNNDSSRSIPALEQSIRDLRISLAKKQSEIDQLHIVAAQSGHVFPSKPRPDAPTESNDLSRWTSSPTSPENLGCYLETGQLFCHIGDPEDMCATIAIPQQWIKFVSVGQKVLIRLEEYPSEDLTGTIEDMALTDLQLDSRSGIRQGGSEQPGSGEIVGKQSSTEVSYEARVRLDAHNFALLPGFQGQAKIRTRNQTIASRVNHFLHRTFHFR